MVSGEGLIPSLFELRDRMRHAKVRENYRNVRNEAQAARTAFAENPSDKTKEALDRAEARLARQRASLKNFYRH